MERYEFVHSQFDWKSDYDRVMMLMDRQDKTMKICTWVSTDYPTIYIHTMLLDNKHTAKLVNDFFLRIAAYYDMDTIVLPTRLFLQLKHLKDFVFVVGTHYSAIKVIK